MSTKYTEGNARALLNSIHARLDFLNALTEGSKSPLAYMLKDGGFPETESKALLDALNAAGNALDDLEMAMLIGFQDPDK